MSVKPSNLIYDADERPPTWISLLLGLQHVVIVTITFIFPVVIVREMGGTTEQAEYLISMSMLAGGVGVVLQALKRGPIGSGYLCPQLCGPSFLSASILAAKSGGLSLVMGLTVIAGVTEILFSRIMHRLRFMFPPEVTGLIVAMVGLTVIKLAVSRFFGLGGGGEVVPSQDQVVTMFFGLGGLAGPVDGGHGRELLVAVLTLGTMVGLNVWSKGKLKLFCILLGMVVGYLSSWAVGLLGPGQFGHIAQAATVSLPFSQHPGWSFDFHLAVPIIIAAVCSSLKSVGDITTCQKINDAEWKRPDMVNIKKGILADGLGCLSAGIFGGYGQSTSSSNIGLSIATGATSRVIAWATGGLLVVLAFFPKLAAVFAIMPQPVMGATLIFALSFMFIAGMQMVMSRMLDARKTFVVGISIIFGLSVDMLPEFYAGFPAWVHPVFSSALSATAVMAIALNLIFRIGVASKVDLTLTPGQDQSADIARFMDQQGGAWGARPEVINKASAAGTELWEALTENRLIQGPFHLTARFDEFNLDLQADYRGRPMVFPDAPPGRDEILGHPDGHVRLAGHIIKRLTDRISAAEKDGEVQIKLHFEH